jgi:hypothetical protein
MKRGRDEKNEDTKQPHEEIFVNISYVTPLYKIPLLSVFDKVLETVGIQPCGSRTAGW